MTFETLIIFLTIENNTLNIHRDPWIKSDRDSIRNSRDVFSVSLQGSRETILTIVNIARQSNKFVLIAIYRKDPIENSRLKMCPSVDLKYNTFGALFQNIALEFLKICLKQWIYSNSIFRFAKFTFLLWCRVIDIQLYCDDHQKWMEWMCGV